MELVLTKVHKHEAAYGTPNREYGKQRNRVNRQQLSVLRTS